MKLLDRQAQKKMPVLEALERFKKMRVVPFDVPGHKRGRGNKALLNFFRGKMFICRCKFNETIRQFMSPSFCNQRS